VIITTMVGVREQAKVTENEIHSAISSLIAAVTMMLRDREAVLISDVETTKYQKEKELQLQKDELELLLTGIRHAALFSEALVKEGSDTEIVAGHQQVVARMTTLTSEQEKAQLEPVIDTVIEFVGVEERVELLSSVIQKLGTVVSTGISVEQSIIEKPMGNTHQINRAYLFKVILVDKKGDKVSREMMSKSFKGLAVAVTGPSQVLVLHSFIFFFFSIYFFLSMQLCRF